VPQDSTWDFFKSHNVYPEDEWSSLIFVEVYPNGTFVKDVQFVEGSIDPVGYIFVIEPEKADPKYKMPGGHKHGNENPAATALRELRGETGLEVPDSAIRFMEAIWREFIPRADGRFTPDDHWSILFRARVEESEVPWMHNHDIENEGEIPKFFTHEQFVELCERREFLPYHFRRLRDVGLLPLEVV